MEIFLSWSQERSKEIAINFKEFIELVLSQVDVFLSADGIEYGLLWQKTILGQANSIGYGILLVTPENKNSTWMHFEAGLMLKDFSKDRVVPVLFGLTPNNIDSPINLFQMSEYNEFNLKKLFREINAMSLKKLPDSILFKLFDTFYPEFDNKISEILKRQEVKEIERPESDVLKEILSILRHQQRNVSFNSNDRKNNSMKRARYLQKLKAENINQTIDINQIPPVPLDYIIDTVDYIKKSISKGISAIELEELISKVPRDDVRDFIKRSALFSN